MKKVFLLLCCVLLALTTACSTGTTTSIKDGSYTASSDGNNGPVEVAVTIEGGKIASVEIVNNAETPEIAGTVFEKFPAMIVEHQTLKIDAVSGATNTSNAVLNAVADCIKQAGGKFEDFQNEIVVTAKTITKEADVVIVGAGAAGLFAAEKLLSNGHTVILLEKGATLDVANWSSAGGPSAAETKQQELQGVEVTNEFMAEHMLEFANSTVNAALLYEVVERTGDAVDKLMELGIGLFVKDDTYGVGFQGRHYILGGEVSRTEAMKKAIESFGGEIMFETAGESLILDENGKVTGVKAHQGNDEVIVNAKAVLVSTGGYLGNEEMIHEHFGEINVVPLGNTLSTGDGINMVLEAGGILDRNWALISNEFSAANSKASGALLWGPNFNQNFCFFLYGGLMVDANGNRVASEQRIADEPLSIGGEIIARAGKLYAVVDEAFMQGAATLGAYEYLGAPETWLAGKAMMLPVISKAPEQVDAAIEEGWGCKVETLEELSNCFSGMEDLDETIANYNEMAANGVDTEFGKDAAFLNPIAEGPFYIFEYEPSAWGTLGGVKVDNKLRALSASNEIIEGLYVAGVDAGSMYANPYYDNEGAALGLAMGSGVYAGEMISDYLGE